MFDTVVMVLCRAAMALVCHNVDMTRSPLYLQEHLAEVKHLKQTYGWHSTMADRLHAREQELGEIEIKAREWKEQTTQALAAQFEIELSRQLKK